MNKTLTGLASAFALCTSITAAQANPVDVVVDDNLHQKLFRISENWNIPGTSTITRGMLDEAANVYCEWTSSADIDANNKISNVHEISRSCKEAEPSDTAPFSGGKETDFSTAFSNYQHFIAPGMNTNTVIDLIMLILLVSFAAHGILTQEQFVYTLKKAKLAQRLISASIWVASQSRTTNMLTRLKQR